MLEAAFSEATEMDGSMLLTLAPESMVSNDADFRH